MDTVEIVPIAETHIEGFHACLDAVARERRFLALLEAPSLTKTGDFVRSNIANGNPQFVAVAAGERVVGWCDVMPQGLEGFKHVGKLGMGILPEYRGQGIGRRLMQATLESAKRRGMEKVELDVFAPNLPAIALYEQIGFVVEGVRKKARRVDGIYEDVVMMGLWL